MKEERHFTIRCNNSGHCSRTLLPIPHLSIQYEGIRQSSSRQPDRKSVV